MARTIEYHSAATGSEVGVHTSMQLNLKNIYAKREKPDAKGHIIGFHLCEVSMKTEPRSVVAGGWGRAIGSDCLMGTGLTFG